MAPGVLVRTSYLHRLHASDVRSTLQVYRERCPRHEPVDPLPLNPLIRCICSWVARSRCLLQNSDSLMLSLLNLSRPNAQVQRHPALHPAVD